MYRGRARVWLTVSVMAVVLSLGLSACGSDSGSGSGGSSTTSGGGGQGGWTNGYFGPADEAGSPVDGGSITMGMYSEPSGLDPIVAGGGGYAGGTELAAIFDVLVRYDSTNNEYVPQLAEAATANEDSTAWTVKLRDGVKFTDGTTLDSAAVKSSFERFNDPDANSRELVANIASIDTPDALTVVFNLKAQDPGFQFVLGGMTGMIVSPTAVANEGAEFANKPVGAGPFMLDHWSPAEEIVLKKNPDYWGEKAHLDTVKFVVLEGGKTTFETLDQGGIQTAFLLEPKVAAEAKSKGYAGLVDVVGAGDGLIINAGAAGQDRIGKDERVRKAIGLAIDAQQVYTRVFGSDGVPGNFVVAPGSPYDPGVPALEPNATEAKKLFDEVKSSESWDGKLELACDNTPSRTTTALTVQAQLKAVGIDAEIATSDGIGDLIGEIYKGNYDIACYGYSVFDALPYDSISRNLLSTSEENRSAYSNADMDAAIGQLQVAKSTDEAKTAIGEIQKVWNEDPPFITFDNTPMVTVFGKNVHGIQSTIKAQVLVGQAWVSK